MGNHKKGCKSWKQTEIIEKEKRSENYVKFATKLSVRTKLDVDTFVKAEPNEIQRLLHRTLFLCSHQSLH